MINVADIHRLYSEGCSFAEIGSMYNVSKQYIHQVYKTLGVRSRPVGSRRRFKVDASTIALIKERRDNRVGWVAIAKELHTSAATLRKLVDFEAYPVPSWAAPRFYCHSCASQLTPDDFPPSVLEKKHTGWCTSCRTKYYAGKYEDPEKALARKKYMKEYSKIYRRKS